MTRAGPALGMATLLLAAACGGGSGDATTTTTLIAPSTSAASATTAASAPSTVATTATLPAPPALMQPGDTGALVQALRHYLECGGFGATAGNVFDNETVLAVRAAQEALGVPISGTPDNDTFYILGARCSIPRTLVFDNAEATQLVAGAVSPGGPDEYAFSGAKFQTLTVRPSGRVLLEIKGADGTVLLDSVEAITTFEIELPSTQNYSIRAITAGGGDIYSMAVTLPLALALPTAEPDTVVLDGVVFRVASRCAEPRPDGVTHVSWFDRGQTTGLWIAMTAGEFLGVMVDTGTAYDAHRDDIVFSEAGGRFIGRGHVFLRRAGGADEPFPVAFDVSAAAAQECLRLQGNGLRAVPLGARGNEVVDVVRREFGPPLQDTGWQPALSFGGCVGEELRFVRWPGLVVTLTDAATDYQPAGRRHFAAYTADGAVPLFDTAGLGPGNTLGQFRSIHGSVDVEFLVGLEVFFGTVGGDSASNGLGLNLTGDSNSSEVVSVTAGTAVCGE